MKKLARGVAAVLTAAMLLSCVAFASGSDKPTVTAKDTSTTVSFTDADCTQLTLTYKSNAIVKDGLYLLSVVKDDGSGNYVPTESTILDIRQVQAAEAGTVSFPQIFPTEIANSAIIISGDGLSEPVIVATIQLPYVLGDVDEDGEITASDAGMILRAVVGIETLSSNQFLAANLDGDEAITASDAGKLLRVIVGLETLD